MLLSSVKYYEQIFKHIYTRIQDEELAGDITANAFCKAMSNIHKYQHQGFPFSLEQELLLIVVMITQAQKKQRYVD